MELFDHIVETVELTKLLEREICDSLTFTNNLGHAYPSGAFYIKPIWWAEKDLSESEIINTNTYLGPVALNSSIFVNSVENTITAKDIRYMILESESNIAITYPDGSTETFSGYDTKSINTSLYGAGSYNIVYNCMYYSSGTAPAYREKVSLTYDVGVFNITNEKKPYTITSVINRILEAGVTRREGIEMQKYFLDERFSEKYSKVLAPEFYITRCTLFEALLQVGGYIHAIPRLDWDKVRDSPSKIVFDELGGSEQAPAHGQFLEGYDKSVSYNEFCSEIDTYAENLINTIDLDKGSITEPFLDNYKTTRTEAGKVKISNDDAIILTELPIYRITKLEMGFINNNTEVGDLTPFVYEAAEYDTLTNYGGAYPYSKRYALRYVQGDNKITQLSYKVEDPTGGAMEKPALQYIVESKGFVLSGDAAQYKNLAFRVTYIPIVSARVKQRKVAWEGFPKGNALIYNQGANSIESQYFGEHLKGTIARMGNQIVHKTYKFVRLEQIPKVGHLYEGMYVSNVACEYHSHWIKATITMTPDFNRLNTYFGLNSNFRLYDVSEKQSVDRYINYSENVIIGDNVDVPNDTSSITLPKGVFDFTKTFFPLTGDKQVSLVALQTVNKENVVLKSLMLPCLSQAMGNSLMFSFKLQDNFSAGVQALYYDKNINVQSAVPYGDVYGESYYLKLALCDIFTPGSFDQQIATQGDPKFSCNLPQIEDNQFTSAINNAIFSIVDNPLIIQKDSRENIIFTLQLHFRTNRDTIVLGSALSQNNALVSNIVSARAPKMYFLKKPLNKLSSKVDLDGAKRVLNPIIGTPQDSGKRITIYSVLCLSGSWVGWALVDPSDDTLYIGENLPVKAGEVTRPITFTFGNN